MGVTIIPGVDETLGPAIEKFGQGLEKYLRPNREFQLAMQKAISANPALAQNLADLEKTAPGTLENLGFGDLGKAISAIPMSASAREEVAKRPKAGEAATTEQTASIAKNQRDTAKAGLDISDIKEITDYFKDTKGYTANNPDKVDAIRVKLGLPTLASEAQTKAATRHTGLLSDEVQSDLELKKEKAQFEKAAYDKAIEQAPDLAKENIVQLVRNLLGDDNAASTEAKSKLDSMALLPRGKETLEAAYRFVMADEQYKHSSALEDKRLRSAEARAETRLSDAEIKNNKQKATQAYISTHVGSPEAWYTVLSDPEALSKVVDKHGDLTPSELAVMDVFNYQDRQAKFVQQKQISDVVDKIRTAHEKLIIAGQSSSVTPSSLAEFLDQLNLALSARLDVGLSPMIAAYGKVPPDGAKAGALDRGVTHPFGGKEGVYFTDTEGRKLPDDQVYAVPNLSRSGLSSDALRASMEIKAQRLTRAKELEALERIKNAPMGKGIRIYNELAPSYGLKPIAIDSTATKPDTSK